MTRSIVVFLLLAAVSMAQAAGLIRGVVLSEAGEPLKGAQITVRGTRLGAVSLHDGSFEIRETPVGYVQVIAWMTGYESRIERVYVQDGAVSQVKFNLVELVIPLPAVQWSDTVPRVTVTATIVPMPLEKVPSAVEIITDEKLQEMGALTVADALMESQSVYLQGDEDRSLSASLRGLRTTHTLVLINGRRVPPGLRGVVNLDDLPTAMIRRIEIVRGPSSALYGSDAIGGVVNIITKRPPEHMVAGISTRYGQSRYGEAQNPFIKGYMAESLGQLSYSLFAAVDRENQFDRYKETPWTDGDRKNLRSGGVELGMDLTGRQLVQGGFEKSLVRRRGIRPYDWGNGKRTTDDNRKSFFLEYNYVVPEKTEFVMRGHRYRFDSTIGIFPEIFGPKINPYTQSEQDYEVIQILNQVESRLTHTFPAGNRLTLGAERRWEERRDNFSDHDITNSAAFIQDIFEPVDRVLLVLGARLDDHSQFGTTFSPKASFTLSLLENLRLKSSYGRGIRAPSVYELYIESPTKESVIRPNMDLRAEKSNTWEVGLEGGYGPVSAQARFFRNDLRDMINPVQVGYDSIYPTVTNSFSSTVGHQPWIRPVLRYMNIEQAMSQGFEMNLSIRLTDRILFSDDVTLMETRDKATDRRLLNKPDLLNTAELRYEHEEKMFKAGVRLSSVGTRVISDTYRADGFSLVNLFVSKRFSQAFEVYGGVNNLLNNDPNIYGYQEGAGSPGTFFFFGLTMEIWDHSKRW